MSPICARPSCMALTMSVPVSTTSILASTPCLVKKPFSAPMNIGRWPKLLPITTSSLGKSAIAYSPFPARYFLHWPLRRPIAISSFAQHLRVDAVGRRAANEQRLNIVHNDIGHLLAHLHGGAAEVWIEHYVFHPPQFIMHSGLVLEYVESGAGYPLCLERAHQSSLIDDRSARGVDNECCLLHQTKLARANLMAGIRVERRMYRDEIGFAQQLVERHESEAGF